MKRVEVLPRPGWERIVEEQGLTWHSEKAQVSWNERAAYVLTRAEADGLCRVAREVVGLFKTACAYVAERKLWRELGLDEPGAKIVSRSWGEEEFSLCGRFDFLFDEEGIPKLLEFNAETALSLVESSVIQKKWQADVMPGLGQCNELDAQLIRAWKQSGVTHVHCAWRPRHAEVEGTVRHMTKLLEAAGIRRTMMALHRMGWQAKERCFVDEEGAPIRCCYKIYPWSWMLAEPFARHVEEAKCKFIEPPWRLMAGGKGILAVLAELFPDHSAVLPCYRSPEKLGSSYVSKPIFGYEGHNVSIHQGGEVVEARRGEYGADEKVFQKFVASPRFDGYLPQFGVWMVGDEPVAIGIRETKDLIVSADSAFVPHAIASV